MNMGDGKGSAASVHLFAPIQAPRINSISRKTLQDFSSDWEAYEDAISAQPGLKAVSYRSCFTATYLRSLIRARAFVSDIKEVSDLTDGVLRSKIQSLATGPKAVSCEEALSDVKKNVRLDANEPHPKPRILMLSASYLELSEKRAWKFVETSQKAAIKHIISVLQPPKLKTRVQDALELEKADLKNDCFGSMEFLSEKAVVFEEVEPLREYRQSKNAKRNTNVPKKKNESSAPN